MDDLFLKLCENKQENIFKLQIAHIVMQNKRGQVTLFIIIAIIIVAIIVLAIVLQGGLPGSKMSDNDISKVKSYLDSCFETKTEQGILFIAKQGGYNVLPEASINFIDEKTAYYLKNDQLLIPNVASVERELTDWLNEHASECLSMPNYQIGSEKCTGTATITTDTVKAAFNCPVTIKKGVSSSQIRDFNVNVNAPIANLLDASAKVVDEYKKQPGYLCITCFDLITSANNVTIKIVPITKETYEPEHIWFLITDKNIKFEDKNITWRFVIEK